MMRSVTNSIDFPLPTEDGVRGYISVHFGGLSSDQNFEDACKLVYNGKRFSEIKKHFITPKERKPFAEYLELRSKYEVAIQTANKLGQQLFKGDRIELDGEYEKMTIINRFARWCDGRFFMIYILSDG